MIQILKASAGSGKTYNLAREYIRLLLVKKDPQAYRHILAVTFTNKATDEMKRRILDELYVLAVKPAESPYYKDFVPKLFPTSEALQKRASSQLGGILHDYSSFAVSTIDKFFQQTLRAFSREIGQFSSYQVELDKTALVEESVERILDGLTENDRGLLDWLTENVKAGLENGNRFNLEPPLKEMAVNLKSTDYADAVLRFKVVEENAYAKEHLKEVRKRCDDLARTYKKDVADAAKAALDVLRRHGVELREHPPCDVRSMSSRPKSEPFLHIGGQVPLFLLRPSLDQIFKCGNDYLLAAKGDESLGLESVQFTRNVKSCGIHKGCQVIHLDAQFLAAGLCIGQAFYETDDAAPEVCSLQ